MTRRIAEMRGGTRRPMPMLALVAVSTAACGAAAPDPAPAIARQEAPAKSPVEPAPKPAAPHVEQAKSAAPEGKSAAGAMEFFDVESKLLRRKVEVAVYLPADYATSQKRYPTLYFLHGRNGVSKQWEEHSTPKKIDALIESGKLGPLLVVCPDCADSMYVNWRSGEAPWQDHLATELIPAIEAKYRAIPDRKLRGLTGDAVGGFGAMILAFRHPELFGSLSASNSSIYPVDPAELSDRVKRRLHELPGIFGWPIDADHWKQFNPLHLAATVPEEELKSLAIAFDCGDRDRYGFNGTNEELHKILEKRGIPHEWQLREGGHGRDFFEENVERTLLFHGALFAAALQPAPSGR